MILLKQYKLSTDIIDIALQHVLCAIM